MRKPVLVLGLLALGSALSGAGSCRPGPALSPQPGLPEFQQSLAVPVPGAVVNVAGNNLRVMREDLSLDTRIGGYSLGAVYDATAGGWRWSFEMTYDGTTLVDAGGAQLSTAGLAPGDAIPGTQWVVLGPAALKTKGGLVHRFDGEGRLAAIHWGSDAYPRIETRLKSVAGELRIEELEQCRSAGSCSRVVHMHYDAAGRLQQLDDRSGRRAEFTWDAEDRLVQARDALDVARGWPGFRYEYDGSRLSAQTNSEGERVEFSESGSTLEVRAVGEEDPTWRFVRLAESGGTYRTRVTDPLGHTRTFHYDAARRLLRVENALGEAVEWAWQGKRPVRRTLPDGSTTTWVVSGDDTVLEMQPGGNVIQIAYAPDAVNRGAPERRPLLRVEDSIGVVEEYAYDEAGRLVAWTDGAGDTTALTYDSDGQLVQMTGPDGSTLGFDDYGDHGHPETLVVDSTTYARSFDSVGNLLQRSAMERDFPGVYQRDYDEDRNVTTVWVTSQGEGSVFPSDNISIERGSDGRLLAIARPGLTYPPVPGPAAAYLYDALGRLVERQDRAGGAWRSTRFEWDAAGRLTAVERPNGLREERAYDAAGRVVLQVFGRGTPFAAESAAAYSWLDGRLSEVSDSSYAAPERYAYDAAGRVAQVTYPAGEVLVPEWDPRGRLQALDLSDGGGFAARVGLAYDGAGREIGLWLDGAPLQQRTFADARLVEVRHGNGLVRSFSEESPLERSAETRDAGGTLVAQTRLYEAPAGDAALCVDLEVETFVGLAAQSAEQHCLGGGGRMSDGVEFWDGTGDPLAWGSATPFEYGPDFALLQEGAGHSYAYDEAGFATDRDGDAVTYDAAGRPASVGSDYAFTWDAQGRPVSETTPEGTIGRRFGGLVETDAAGVPRILDLGAVRADLVAGEHRFRHFDPRGNVAFVTDPAGAVRTVYRYGAFGVAEVQGDDDDPVRFARGRQVGDLVLLGQRLLDPAVGRFLSPDPLYQLQSQYAYAWGDSLLFWDPSGLEGTLHGFTAGQLAAAFGFAAAGAAPYAILGGPAAAAIPATSFFIAAWLTAIDSAGGFQWTGDRTVWELFNGAAGRSGARLGSIGGGESTLRSAFGPGSLPSGSIGTVPNILNRFRPKEEGGLPGPEIHFSNGVSVPICAPTGVRAGGRSSALWTLICVNLVLGAVLVHRARSARS